MLAACYRCFMLGLLALTTGCAMCSSCDDYTYGAYGGRWERLDPCYGRVGSAFTPEVGSRVELDELYAPELQGMPTDSQKPAESLQMEPMPDETAPADSMPAEGTPAEGEPAEGIPGAMPADDAAPQPPETTNDPQSLTDPDKSSDASVLRKPSRPRR